MKNAKAVVLTAALLLVVMLFSACGGASIDYKADDMGQYVTLSSTAYEGKEIAVYKQPLVDDDMIGSQMLTNVSGQWTWDAAKKATSVYVKDKGIPENENALVFVYFYAVTEDGKPFKGSSSFVKGDSKDTVSNNPSAYLIGAGSAQSLLHEIDGFGEKLQGLKPSDTSFAYSTGTEIKDGSVIYLTTKATYTEPGEVDKDGKPTTTTVTYDDWTMTNVRIDLNQIPADLQVLLGGSGESDFLTLAKVNKSGKSFKMTKNKINIDGTDRDVTVTATINYVVKDTAIELTLPEDYSEEKLQGKKVTVYVALDGYMSFKDVAAKLGDDGKEFKAESSEGSLFDAYRKHVKKDLDESYKKTVEANKRNAVWNYLLTEAKISVPFEILTPYYDEALENYHWQYQNGSYYGVIPYSSMYESFEKMMVAMTGSNNWDEALHEMCEEEIKGRMLLHYLADNLKITVAEKEVKEALKAEGLNDSQIADLSEEELLGYEEALLWDRVTEKLCEAGRINVVEQEKSTEADTEEETTGAENTEANT